MKEVAFIYSHDGDDHGIRFGVEICTPGTLRETVKKHLHPEGIQDDEAEMFAGVMEELDEKGAVDFEDGWIVAKHGAAAIVDFMLEQLRETKAEERYEGERGGEERLKREAAEMKYKTLQSALITALGTNGPAIAAQAAA